MFTPYLACKTWHGLSESGVPPNSVLFGGIVLPNSVLVGGTVPGFDTKMSLQHNQRCRACGFKCVYIMGCVQKICNIAHCYTIQCGTDGDGVLIKFFILNSGPFFLWGNFLYEQIGCFRRPPPKKYNKTENSTAVFETFLEGNFSNSIILILKVVLISKVFFIF